MAGCNDRRYKRGFSGESGRQCFRQVRKRWRVVPATSRYSRVTRTHSGDTRSSASPVASLMIQYPMIRPSSSGIGARRRTAPTGMSSSWSRSRARQMVFMPRNPGSRPVLARERSPDTAVGVPRHYWSREPRTGVQSDCTARDGNSGKRPLLEPAGVRGVQGRHRRLYGGLNAHRAGPSNGKLRRRGMGAGGDGGRGRQGAIFAPARRRPLPRYGQGRSGAKFPATRRPAVATLISPISAPSGANRYAWYPPIGRADSRNRPEAAVRRQKRNAANYDVKRSSPSDFGHSNAPGRRPQGSELRLRSLFRQPALLRASSHSCRPRPSCARETTRRRVWDSISPPRPARPWPP